ncbi:PEP-CTERM sorting domain-containing protein [Methyloversatilis sp. XJ19-13]|jgi:hypothetical protein|uniref:PEP-CTERM sorting domain-containing protein n=1 Tax=Methyloversatilis sp. XJ19-13 TaxID=2963430 RepID=UPI00211CDE54|nr:PEP-CTERM sorting domain-containing protein [Methyloversatilis sp. XJ19-13]MCQ9375496.1 PEP-CTERM sorting domain-containing protein [Methyloversatilis sp. XJ19-13]
MKTNNTPRRALRAALLVAALATAPMAAEVHAEWNSNLILNGGAESATGGDGSYLANSLPGWAVSGELTAISYELGGPAGYPTSTDPGPADRGANLFGGGYAGLSRGTQTISLDFASGSINGAGAYFSLSGWLGGYGSQNDNATLSVTYLDAANNVIGTHSVGPVLASERDNATAMLYRESAGWVPMGATSALVELSMSRTGGSSNDGYADNLALSLAPANVQLSAPTTAGIGATFDVTVALMSPFGGVYGADELLAFGFDLGFDTSLLKLANVSVAAPWDDDSAFFDDVNVAGSVFESITDQGQESLQLATLTFEVLAVGEVFIDIHSNAGNLNHGLTYLNGENANLFGRTSVALVPEPGTWLMMGAGLLILFLRRRNA